MNKKKLEKIKSIVLDSRLSKIGFKRWKYRYLNKKDDFYYSFMFTIYDYNDIFPSNFSYGIGNKTVTKICRLLFPEEYNIPENKYALTMAFHQIQLFEEGRYPNLEYKITNENELYDSLNETIKYFETTGFPELIAISNLKQLDKLINENPENPLSGYHGLILAKLVNNPDYQNLISVYRNLFKKKNWQNEEDIKKLETVISFLNDYSSTELLEIGR
ncbi:hypothetical protein [Pseudotamlana carrageenivorans]|uniref:DUF4304 domain-containing protein n=1 Tax=Pseudotamlana carrageenivorans TaxID=2069432 RepID=A0A2I7SJP1_9FLAO|nr:hypothetical protein [Tamlana carrageenivorans]AUS06130.1 hypothetical protein C1A40_12005 [Tamlana carrageenivorans]